MTKFPVSESTVSYLNTPVSEVKRELKSNLKKRDIKVEEKIQTKEEKEI